MDWIAWISYLAAGALAGMMSGMLGVGGGVVVVPTLLFIFSMKTVIPYGLQMPMAIGTSLAIMVITLASSVYAHHQRGMVNWALVKIIFPGLVVGILFGTMLVRFLPSDFLQGFFSIFLVVIALRLFFFHDHSRVQASKKTLSNASMVSASGVVGLLSSLLGAGGGTMWVPLFLYCKRPMHEAVGTSVACGVVTAVLASTSLMVIAVFSAMSLPLSTGFVYWPAFFGISLASVLFAPIGAAVAYRIPARWLQYGFALFMLFVAVQMMFFNRL